MLFLILILGLLAFVGYYIVMILPNKIIEAHRIEHERMMEEELKPYRHQAVSEIEEFLTGLKTAHQAQDDNENRNQINEIKK